MVNNDAIAKGIDWSLETDGKALLLKIVPLQLTEHWNGAGAYTSLHPYCLMFMVLEQTVHATKGER